MPAASDRGAALAAAVKALDARGIARALLAGADAGRSLRGWTPLAALIQEDPHGDEPPVDEAARQACIAALLDGGASLEQRSGFPAVAPLVLAGLGGRREVAELLLARGARCDAFAQAALGRPGLRRDLAREPALARARDEDGFTLLHFACGSRMGRDDARVARELLALVEALLDAGADPDARGVARKAPLVPSCFAIGALRFEETRLLFERGADATGALTTALWNTKGDHARFGELCLAHGAQPDAARSAGRPLLNDLVRWGRFEPARWLLARGADPNQPDDHGFTALHQAASRGNRAMWEALLAAGGDAERRANDGSTPRAFALRKKLIALVRAPARAAAAERRAGGKPPRAAPPRR